jgi:hypothetical protein
VLCVEWVDGSEARRLFDPKVLVDDEVAGDVDTELYLSPGDHQVRVKKGWLKTRPLSVSYQVSKRVVLEYKSGGFPFSITGVTSIAVPAIVSYLLYDVSSFGLFGKLLTIVVFVGIWLTLAGAVAAMQTVLDRYGITVFTEGNLDVGRDRPPSGRLVVNLIISTQNGIQPPRPKVIVDGKPLGTVALTHRVPPGLHTVHIRGWFDSSNKLPVQVQSGELLEIECETTNWVKLTVCIIGVCFVIAMLAIMLAMSQFEMYDWSIPLLAGAFVASALAAHVVSRFFPTLTLYEK